MRVILVLSEAMSATFLVMQYLIRYFTLSLFVFTLTLNVNLQAEDFEQDWSKYKNYPVPEWFQDAKLGIYFHWGVYSVPAYGSEWYPRWMYFEGRNVHEHHTQKYGDPAEFGYHDFVPKFKAEYFDAKEWVDLFEKAGARFAGPVAEHHDGFAMWDSAATPWNVADKGPMRDITGELAKEIRKRDMKFIATFHHARHLFRPNHPESFTEEYPNGRYFWHSHFPDVPALDGVENDDELKYLYGRLDEGQWLEEVWFEKLKEVIAQYSPDIIWFDSWLDKIPENYRKAFIEHYYNHAAKKDKEVVVTYKQTDFPESVAVFNIEKGGKVEISESVWQSDDTISLGSWCYTDTLEVKPTSMVVHGMIDIVSKNGILLLNVSPKANGIIPDDQRKVLLEMGEWLDVNGEAIYATRPWLIHGEGPTGWEEGRFGGMKTTNVYTSQDKRYTRSKDDNYIYAFVLAQPTMDETVQLSSFAEGAAAENVKISGIELIGSSKKVQWKQNSKGIQIKPTKGFTTDIALVYKLTVK